METQPTHIVIPADLAGERLDRALAVLLPEYSRARLQAWIRSGRATVDSRRLRPRDRVCGGERVELTPQLEREVAWEPQPLPLCVVHEDPEILVVDKPPGLVVHPGAGNPGGTLVNALLHRDPGLAGIPRAGVVHRLDKDTSGLLVVARTLRAHRDLVEQLRRRSLRREYDAVVVGVLRAGGTVDAPVGRHPVARKRMAVTPSGRSAVTHFRVRQRFRRHTRLRLVLESGRTHQIRVHMAHIGHPVLGDPAYGRRPRVPAGAPAALAEALRVLRRQALHATRLELRHPGSGGTLRFDSPPPPDLAELLRLLAEELPDA